MLDSLKKVGREIGEGLSRAWENLAEGWREILSRAGGALTHFSRSKEGKELAVAFPSWGLLAGEVIETSREILVRLEVPGLEKEDCEVTIEGNHLVVRGEKRAQWEEQGEHYHLLECAYGSFQRVLPLPASVDLERAQASYRNGVLTVKLPKTGTATTRRIAVQ